MDDGEPQDLHAMSKTSIPSDADRARALASAMPELAARARALAEAAGPGAHGRRRAGPGDAFWQHRRILPGESAAGIDWRVSAKAGAPHARETEWVSPSTASIHLDLSASMDWRSQDRKETKLGRAVLLGLACACLLLESGEACALGGSPEPPARTPQGLDNLAAAVLGRLSKARGSWEEASVRTRRGVVLTDLLEPMEEIERGLRRLTANGTQGRLLAVLDPAELSHSWSGRLRLFDPEGGFEILAERAEAAREHYQDALGERMAAAESLCRRLGWEFQVHSTADAPDRGLLFLRGAFEGEGE